MITRSFLFKKLIRDKMCNWMQQQGFIVHTKTINIHEHILELKNKLIEEAQEVQQTDSQDELVEEIADVLEVIESLYHATGVTKEHVEAKRLQKREKCGGFYEKMYVCHIDINKDDIPMVEYYIARSSKYPELKNKCL